MTDRRLEICKALGFPDIMKAHEMIVAGASRGPDLLMNRGLTARLLSELGYDAAGMKRLGYQAASLERLGYQVDVRTNGVEALEAFRNQSEEKQFDLVITDMTMPHLTGIQLAKELLKLDPNLAILLCTGFSEQADAEKAKRIGIQGFLMKPVVLKELAGMVRKVLDEKLK